LSFRCWFGCYDCYDHERNDWYGPHLWKMAFPLMDREYQSAPNLDAVGIGIELVRKWTKKWKDLQLIEKSTKKIVTYVMTISNWCDFDWRCGCCFCLWIS